MTSLNLKAGKAALCLRPKLGGSIASLQYEGRDILQNILDIDDPAPPDMPSIILTPFSNRISGGGFNFGGAFWDVPPNFSGDPLPIHGDGFQKVWTVETASQSCAALTLQNGEIGPFKYAARQQFDLTEKSLKLTLDITNTGDHALPFGCGFHPRFPRTEETRLHFEASGYWENDHRHCARTFAPLTPDFDFNRPKSLPKSLINNGFSVTGSPVQIGQGPQYLSVTMTPSPNLSTAVIFSPGESADFFCYEPVSHPINAYNLPGRPGLTILSSGDKLSAYMLLEWH